VENTRFDNNEKQKKRSMEKKCSEQLALDTKKGDRKSGGESVIGDCRAGKRPDSRGSIKKKKER